ncbi:hypothetical protein OC842_004739 [Tilletia horrida]|uniref:RING-type domain-containing protein n=1 Tax=Tilletia horrida TaxID=155126 RepID=A0AAN6JJ16_9BASI|nr:hypothetical protein OC842_004739 [Tilletia horrida]
MLSLLRNRPFGGRAPRNDDEQQQQQDIERQQQPQAQAQAQAQTQAQAQQPPAPAQQPGRNTAFNAFVQATIHPAVQGTGADANVNGTQAAAAAAPATGTTPRVSRRVRLERDANATLFGPSLANYFPSSSSTTTGVAAAAAATAIATASTPAAAQALPTASADGTAAPSAAAAPISGDAEAVPSHTQDGAVAASSSNPNQPPAFAPLTTVSSINSATLRRPRLGSSGRARGASLSNLSVASLLNQNAQTPNLNNAVESPQVGAALDNSNPNSPYPPPGRPTFPLHRRQYTTDSTWSFPDQNRADNDDDLGAPVADAADDDFGPLPLADAIQLGTLHRWLERAATGGGATLHPSSIPPSATDAAAAPASPGTTTASANDLAPLDPSGNESIPLTEFRPSPASSTSVVPKASSVCTILQSYVNLKRNTFRITLGPAATRSDSAEETAVLNRPALPANVLAPAPSAPVLANPTHVLHFEYDCAAPRCAIHVFVRASRKHGSWNQATQNPTYPALLAGADSTQSGSLSPYAPPHILGFPILAATSITLKTSDNSTQATITPASTLSEAHHLPRGFAQKRAVALRLDMSLYAPPSFSSSKDRGFSPSADQEAPFSSSSQAQPTVPADVAAEVKAAAAKAEEDKEKSKSDKEKAKADKETLKVAIVVEALDDDGKPLSEPNLQTTYLRLTSVPAPVGSAAAVAGSDGKLRVWSAQVEAQEAEIGPHRFQLQELFGLSTRPPPASLAPADTNAGDTGDGAFLTANTDGGAGAEPAEGEEGATEIPTEVPAGSTLNLNGSSATLGQSGGGAGGSVGGGGGVFTPAYMPPADEGTTGSECLICLTSPPSTLLLPCTHGLCLECAIQLRESVKNARDAERRRGKTPRRKYACPVCRRAYTSMLHLSTADEKHLAQASAHGVV